MWFGWYNSENLKLIHNISYFEPTVLNVRCNNMTSIICPIFSLTYFSKNGRGKLNIIKLHRQSRFQKYVRDQAIFFHLQPH